MRLPCLGLAMIASTIGCATAKVQPLRAPDRVEILFKGKIQDTFDTDYHSASKTVKYYDGQMVNDRTEIVDFTVRTSVLGVDADGITTSVKTVNKDGTVGLHDLAFPELNEEMEVKVRPSGEILRAGRYPSDSVFFVPSLPMPREAVAVGDTWTMEHDWRSAQGGIPLRLSAVGILKAVVPCAGELCADVEVSGNVDLVVPPLGRQAFFRNRVWGRVLFGLERGDVVWSEVRSREEMQAGPEKTVSMSCMLSEMKWRRDSRPEARVGKPFACEPSEEAVVW